jgi:hypothetical protein
MGLTAAPDSRSTSTVIYCVITQEMPAAEEQRLRAYYDANPNVEVIRDRRTGGPNDRRRGRAGVTDERRVIRNRRRRRDTGSFLPTVS